MWGAVSRSTWVTVTPASAAVISKSLYCGGKATLAPMRGPRTVCTTAPLASDSRYSGTRTHSPSASGLDRLTVSTSARDGSPSAIACEGLVLAAPPPARVTVVGSSSTAVTARLGPLRPK